MKNNDFRLGQVFEKACSLAKVSLDFQPGWEAAWHGYRVSGLFDLPLEEGEIGISRAPSGLRLLGIGTRFGSVVFLEHQLPTGICVVRVADMEHPVLASLTPSPKPSGKELSHIFDTFGNGINNIATKIAKMAGCFCEEK